MSAEVDNEKWSGEGEFTQKLIDWFLVRPHISFVRVEDAKSSQSDVEYNFISNEIFLRFDTKEYFERGKFLKIFPIRRLVVEKCATLQNIENDLALIEEIGPPDFADDGMIQYLHTERVIPPYQTKGYKLIELVRIYEVGTPSRG